MRYWRFIVFYSWYMRNRMHSPTIKIYLLVAHETPAFCNFRLKDRASIYFVLFDLRGGGQVQVLINFVGDGSEVIYRQGYNFV
jgi:hypothetical protein